MQARPSAISCSSCVLGRAAQDHVDGDSPGFGGVGIVRGAELVITAIPGTDVVPALEKIGEDVLADRIVLDPSSALTPGMR